MVKSLINGLAQICQKRLEAVVLTVDDIEIYDALHDRFQERIINTGISESNAISMAAGLASSGYLPYVIGGNTFMAYRAYEFLRDQICMQQRNVKVIGVGAGLAISVLGQTQQATEDIGALRVLPNLTVITPATPTEVERTICESVNIVGPAFVRVGRAAGEDFYGEHTEFHVDKVQEIKRGKDIAVFATGSIVCDVVSADKELEKAGIDIGIYNVHTIKPLDIDTLQGLSKIYHKWISVEEHNVIGGLGGALSEVLASQRNNVFLQRIGLQDTFANGWGTYNDIKERNHLGIQDIIQACVDMEKTDSGMD